MEQRIESALNEVVNAELWSANFYLSLQAYFEQQQFHVLSSRLRAQADNSMERMGQISSLIYQYGGKVALHAATYRPGRWQNPADALGHAINHERYIDSMGRALINLVQAQSVELYDIIVQLYSKRERITGMFIDILRVLRDKRRRMLPFSVRTVIIS